MLRPLHDSHTCDFVADIRYQSRTHFVMQAGTHFVMQARTHCSERGVVDLCVVVCDARVGFACMAQGLHEKRV